MTRNWLKPDWDTGLSITNLPIKHFVDIGIKALVLDVDGTLLNSKEKYPHTSVLLWIKEAKNNFKLHLFSNNPSKKRIETISKELQVNYTYKAAKPLRGPLRKLLLEHQHDPKQTAIVGDRLFTDVIVGNRLGLYTVLVKPLGPNGKQCKYNRTQQIEQLIAGLLGVEKK